MSKLRKLNDHETVEIGDIIETDTRGFGVRNYTIYRVTKTMAFVKYNDVADGKFPRVYVSFGYSSIPRPEWPTNIYTVYRKIVENG